MSKALHICAAVTGGVAVVLIIVGLATPNMTSSCVPLGDFYDNIPGSLNLPSDIRRLYDGSTQCYHAGLFSISTTTAGLPGSLSHIPSIRTNMRLNNPPTSYKTTAGLLISGVLLISIGLAVFHATQIEACASAKKISVIGLPILIVGVLFVLAGALVFTITQRGSIEDPVRFYTDILLPFLDSLFSGSGISNSPTYEVIVQRTIQALTSAATTYFDFSLYLMWVGFAVAAISAVLSVVAYSRTPRVHVTNDMPMKHRI